MITPLVRDLSAMTMQMLQRAIMLPESSAIRRLLLVNVLEGKHVQRHIWLMSHSVLPCICKLESAAAATNSMAVALIHLNRPSLARLWFEIAMREAPEGGTVRAAALANIMALDYTENNLSRAGTPTHEDTNELEAGVEPLDFQLEAGFEQLAQQMNALPPPQSLLEAEDYNTILYAQALILALRSILHSVLQPQATLTMTQPTRAPLLA